MDRVVGLVNRLQQICTQLGDTAGNSILVDKLSSIVVVGGQVRPSQAQASCSIVMGRPAGRLAGVWVGAAALLLLLYASSC